MSKYLIGRDRFVYGWNPEMAKDPELYEIDLDQTTAEEFEFPDETNANKLAAQVRTYPTAVGDTPDEVIAEAQRKAAEGEPFVTRHASVITLVKEPDALLDMKPLKSPSSLANTDNIPVKEELDAAGNLLPEFNPKVARPDQEDPRPGENAALLRAKGVHDRDQGRSDEDENDPAVHEQRQKEAQERKARARQAIADAKAKDAKSKNGDEE